MLCKYNVRYKFKNLMYVLTTMYKEIVKGFDYLYKKLAINLKSSSQITIIICSSNNHSGVSSEIIVKSP